MMLYTILPAEMLDTILPQEVRQYCNYDKDYTLGEVTMFKQELEDGTFVVCCKLANYKYIENRCCEDEMSEMEIAMAKQFYGEANVFESLEGLKFKENESNTSI